MLWVSYGQDWGLVPFSDNSPPHWLVMVRVRVRTARCGSVRVRNVG